MSKNPRTRLHPVARREEILRIGHQLFLDKPYDEVSLADVAKAAGVSAGLVYHYFGSKRAFAMELVRHKAETLLAVTEPDLDDPPQTRLFRSLEKYIDFLEANGEKFLQIYRSPAGLAPDVRAIADGAFLAHSTRMSAALEAESGELTDHQRLAVHGAVTCVMELCLNWLEDPKISKAELRDLCGQSFLAVLAAAGWEPPGQNAPD